ncbi:MAG: hypothetical protein WCF36_18520 [Candidatus Nanopelagicales bacterium]
MAIELLTVTQAAKVLGRDPSGLHKTIKSGHYLKHEDGRVILVDGRLVTSLEDLVAVAEAARASAEAADRVARAAQDQVEVLNLEFGEFKARSSNQLSAVVDAHEAVARAMRELAPRM